MIYNFYAWLKGKLPALPFTCNSFKADSPDTCVLIVDNGGPNELWYDRKDIRAQCLSRSLDEDEALRNANYVFDVVKSTFHETLPATTVKTIVYPSIVAARIVADQLPQTIGLDEEKRYMYSLNIIITTV